MKKIELLNEVAGISQVVRSWANVIKQELDKQPIKGEEFIVFGEDHPELYEKFSVDIWVLKNSQRIEYDHWKSGYFNNGDYVVVLNVPLTHININALIHEVKHAYDDWNRIKSGGKPIRDTWEIKNIYTKDFEKLVLGGSQAYPQLGPIIRNFYVGSKLEMPAYLENEYDNVIIDYEDVGRKMMNFNLSNYFNKRGQPAKGLESEFESLKRNNDIPLFKKFKNVTEFLNWTKKYFNKRGKDIFKRVAKMRFIHNKPKPIIPQPKKSTSYGSQKKYYERHTRPIGNRVGDWAYDEQRGWYYDPL